MPRVAPAVLAALALALVATSVTAPGRARVGARPTPPGVAVHARSVDAGGPGGDAAPASWDGPGLVADDPDEWGPRGRTAAGLPGETLAAWPLVEVWGPAGPGPPPLPSGHSYLSLGRIRC